MPTRLDAASLRSDLKAGPSPEEIQVAFDELDQVRQWSKANAPKRRVRSIKPPSSLSGKRQRCDAWIKKPIYFDNRGRRHHHGPRCKAWAMANGRCRLHGGASTGARTPEGKARQVAAMAEGRCKWSARQKAAGARFLHGRKTGQSWVTEPMRAAAREQAHKLGARRFDLSDRALVCALLKSTGQRWVGNPPKNPPPLSELIIKAKAMLDAHELAALERDRRAALVALGKLRLCHSDSAVRP